MIYYEDYRNKYCDTGYSAYENGICIGKILKNKKSSGWTAYVEGRFQERFETIIECKRFISAHNNGKEYGSSRYKKKASVKSLPMFSDAEFFPTPSALAGKMMGKVDRKTVNSILEPSAGKGDLADAVFQAVKRKYYNHDAEASEYIDCIEADPNLAAILKSNGYRVVSDDFLTFRSFKHYDLIVMNPPFSNGDEHLLKALDFQKSGGQIVCLLNAETIKNPYTNRRKVLMQKLTEYGASIEFVQDAFKKAERPSDVEVAIVYVNIPYEKPESDILKLLKKAQEEKAQQEAPDMEALTSGNWMEQMVQQYEFEAAVGKKLIDEYRALRNAGYAELLILKTEDKYGSTEENYVTRLRMKYWEKLLNRDELTSVMTSKIRDEYRNKISAMKDYDFSVYNIKTVFREITHQLTGGIEEAITELFELFTVKHSWYPETEKNIHYYSGWATNKAHKVGDKVIIPANGCYANGWKGMELDKYRIRDVIFDLERAMNYLDNGETELRFNPECEIDMANMEHTNKVGFTWFDCTFYKKGTCHIKFKPSAKRIIDRLNIFAGQRKGWLPPNYGKVRYEHMTQKEKAVIDDFQGKEAYDNVCTDHSMLIADSNFGMKLLGA